MAFLHIPQQNLKSTEFKIGLIQTFLNTILDRQQVLQKVLNTALFHLLKLDSFNTFRLKILKLCLNILNVPMFKTSSCICTKVSLRNSTCNILLELTKGKRGNVISGVVERECIELIRVRPSRDPRVNSLHRFGTRFYKNTFESLHLHLFI